MIDDKDAKRLADIWLSLTDEQCAFLKSVVNCSYEESALLSAALIKQKLITKEGAILVPTDDGFAIAKLC